MSQKKEYELINEFMARGVVTSIGQGRFGGRVLNLYVKERRKDLSLVISLERSAGMGISPYDHVLVKGYVKAFRYHNDALDKDSEAMFLTATSVVKERSELGDRLGMEIGRFSPEPMFRGYVVGKVLEATKRDGKPFGLIRLETCGGGQDQRLSRPVVRYYLKGRLPAFDYEPGDVVGLRFSMSTPEYVNQKTGHKSVYQSMAVEDIGYVVPKTRERKKPVQEGVMSEDDLEKALLEDTFDNDIQDDIEDTSGAEFSSGVSFEDEDLVGDFKGIVDLGDGDAPDAEAEGEE